MEMLPVTGKPIAEARNALMQGAVDAGADFLFFLGDDVLPEPDAMIRLLQRLWDNPEISMVTGMYWTKHWPSQPYIWRGLQRGPYEDWKYGEFFQLDFAGCDCLLIRLDDKMKALGPNWFSTEWTWEVDSPAPPLLATEDFYFYTKTRAAGLTLWCDSGVQCIHEDRASGQQFGLTSSMPQFVDSPKIQLSVEAGTDDAPLIKIADLGAGRDGPYWGSASEVKIYRFDGDEAAMPDYRCDLRKLPVPDQSFDIVHSRHALEHFGRAELMPVMKEWVRILRVGGEFQLCVPNIIYAMTQVLLMESELTPPHPYAFWQLYGEQKDNYDFHKNGFTPRRVKLLLESMDCFEDIEVTTRDGDTGDMNIIATAKKAKHLERESLLPLWDQIEAQEGKRVAGLIHTEPEKPVRVKRPKATVTELSDKASEPVLVPA